MGYPKIVEDAHYHIWTDALHGRALARQAKNKWDRGTYVRWTVTSAWTALETACDHALHVTGIARRFKENLDTAVSAAGLLPLDWGSGIWQEVRQLQAMRKGFVHLTVDQEQLFPAIELADSALDVARRAITAIHLHAGQPVPDWIEDDDDRGWQASGTDEATATVYKRGVDPEDPETIRIGFVKNGSEHIDSYLPAETDIDEAVDDLMSRLQVPVSAVFAYQGPELRKYQEIKWRGS
ncbi:MAG: hypothetical protein WD942_02160 [Dehalococcoidia bacterium]